MILKENNAPIRIIRNTSQRIIPSQERRQDSEEATSFDDRWVWHAGSIAVKVTDAEEHERHIETEKQREEGDG